MNPVQVRRLIVAGVVIAGAITALAWRAGNERERRREIVHGRIRPAQGKWIEINGRRLYARVALPPQPSYSPPVVLVHGFGASSTYFIPTVELLAHRFAVYAPDLPGHGKSDAPTRTLTIPQLADSLVAWMDAMQIERACLVGHSMGCQVAVDAAARYPERFDRLALIGPTVDPAGRSRSRLTGRLLRSVLREPPALNAMLVRDYAHMAWRLVSEFAFMRRDRIESKLPLLTQPVMFVRGEHDPIAPQDWLEEAARLCGGCHIFVVPNSAHAVHYSAPQRLVEAITPFLFESWQNFDRTAAGSRTHPPA